jgi:S-adenosylmethionine synthetase
MGRVSEIKKVSFNIKGSDEVREVETFTWEKLDCLDQVKKSFSL